MRYELNALLCKGDPRRCEEREWSNKVQRYRRSPELIYEWPILGYNAPLHYGHKARVISVKEIPFITVPVAWLRNRSACTFSLP